MNRKLTDEIFGLIPALVEQASPRPRLPRDTASRPTRCKCHARAVACRCARAASGPDAAPCLCPMAPLDLSDTVMAALRKQAKSMGVDEARLASDLLKTIVTDNLYMAGLDTRKEPIAA